MTDMQNIIAALIAAIKEKRITVDVAEAAVRILDGVPDYSHLDAIKALLKAPSEPEKQPEDCLSVVLPVNVKLSVSVEEPEPEEQPEDYVAVKTFTSSEFHVGDEVQFNGSYGKRRGIVLAVNSEQIHVLFDSGVAPEYSASAFHRTGRNFPAIPAILDELKKA